MNLLNEDSIWDATLAEAETYKMPNQLRQLFVSICVFSEPSNPRGLWEKYVDNMIEDFIHCGSSREVAIQRALYDINNLLSVHGKCNTDFDIPSPEMSIIVESERDEILRNTARDQERDMKNAAEIANKNIRSFNTEQMNVVKCILHKLYPEENEWNPGNDNTISRDIHLFLSLIHISEPTRPY